MQRLSHTAARYWNHCGQKRAGIDYLDNNRRVVDFHALRHQFISNLVQAGVHPKEAQTLARHSTIKLTMDRYTHLGIVNLTTALDKLPALPATHSETHQKLAKATGTDGRTPYTALRQNPDIGCNSVISLETAAGLEAT